MPFLCDDVVFAFECVGKRCLGKTNTHTQKQGREASKQQNAGSIYNVRNMNDTQEKMSAENYFILHFYYMHDGSLYTFIFIYACVKG